MRKLHSSYTGDKLFLNNISKEVIDELINTTSCYYPFIKNLSNYALKKINLQEENINSLFDKANNLTTIVASTSSKIKDQNTRVEEINTKIDLQEKKTVETSITIVGIFVAIISVLFGGFSFINSGLSALGLHSFKLFILIGIIALVLFDSVLALFYFMAKITGKTIASSYLDPQKYINNDDNKFIKLYVRLIKIPILSVSTKSKFAFWVNLVLMAGVLFVYCLFLATNNTVADITFIKSALSLIPSILLVSVVLLITNENYVFFVPINNKEQEHDNSEQNSN